MGDLDTGPVIGGYLGLLLLAGAYLSIGLCVSAVTDNQIVSLIVTVVVCGLFYLPGADTVASLFGVDASEVLRRLGTGSRFHSIARGVVDLRDMYTTAAWWPVPGDHTVLLKMRGWPRPAHPQAALQPAPGGRPGGGQRDRAQSVACAGRLRARRSDRAQRVQPVGRHLRHAHVVRPAAGHPRLLQREDAPAARPAGAAHPRPLNEYKVRAAAGAARVCRPVGVG